jgi:hypothetical protein
MSLFNPFSKQNPDGSWYSKEDYAKLLAENETLKAEVEDWRNSNRVKAVRIEAQILDRIVELKKENSRLLDAGDALAYAARHQMAYETELEGWRAAKSPTPFPNDNPTPQPL